MKIPRDHEVQTEELEGGGCTLKDAQTCVWRRQERCKLLGMLAGDQSHSQALSMVLGFTERLGMRLAWDQSHSQALSTVLGFTEGLGMRLAGDLSQTRGMFTACSVCIPVFRINKLIFLMKGVSLLSTNLSF